MRGNASDKALQTPPGPRTTGGPTPTPHSTFALLGDAQRLTAVGSDFGLSEDSLPKRGENGVTFLRALAVCISASFAIAGSRARGTAATAPNGACIKASTFRLFDAVSSAVSFSAGALHSTYNRDSRLRPDGAVLADNATAIALPERLDRHVGPSTASRISLRYKLHPVVVKVTPPHGGAGIARGSRARNIDARSSA